MGERFLSLSNVKGLETTCKLPGGNSFALGRAQHVLSSTQSGVGVLDIGRWHVGVQEKEWPEYALLLLSPAGV